MFPGSIPHFVEACRVWRELGAAGRVAAGPRYRAWAELAGQGGYGEASRKGGAGTGAPHGSGPAKSGG